MSFQNSTLRRYVFSSAIAHPHFDLHYEASILSISACAFAGDTSSPGPQSRITTIGSSGGCRKSPSFDHNEFMAIRRSRERRPSVVDIVDGVLFAFAGLATIWLAYLVFRASIQPGWPMLLLIVFWVLLTYLLLPRLHRILTRLYVPGYFIGRARTSDGLLGDPVNLALRGHEPQVHAAMTRASWIRADDLSLTSGRRILTSTLSRRSYAEAPVSPLHLFDRQQDFAYQQEVAGSPSKRHHVRFWRCPEGWMLPGGYEVDWLAAGTYDRSVGLSLFTLQVTHKIEENTDIERDFIVETVSAASPEVEVEVIENFSTGYHSRNGGGDLIITDGNLPIIDVRRIEVPETAEVEHTDSRDKRPAQIVFGAGVGFFRGLGYLLIALLLLPVSRPVRPWGGCRGRASGADPGGRRGRPSCIDRYRIGDCRFHRPQLGAAGADVVGRVDHNRRIHRQCQRIRSRHLGHQPANRRAQHHGLARLIQPPGSRVRHQGAASSQARCWTAIRACRYLIVNRLTGFW